MHEISTENNPTLTWAKSSAREAQGLWCHQCEKIIAIKYQGPFPLKSVKGLHERGSGAGHKVEYVKLERINEK